MVGPSGSVGANGQAGSMGIPGATGNMSFTGSTGSTAELEIPVHLGVREVQVLGDLQVWEFCLKSYDIIVVISNNNNNLVC